MIAIPKRALSRLGVPIAIASAFLGMPVRGDVLLQGFYWDVASPAAGDPNAPWWYDRLAQRAPDIAAAGFTSVWLPPVHKGASGGFSVGYDPFDDYDIGAKNQKGTVPTRYGTRFQLQRTAAVLRANGLSLMADLVLNHRNGDDGNFNFSYLDAYGNPGLGRYGKSAFDFSPPVANDPDVFDSPEMGFGRNVAFYNGGGVGNTSAWNFNQLIAAGDWLVKALDLSSVRLDYAKGLSTSFVSRYLAAPSLAGKFAVAEFWDDNRDIVREWKGRTGHRVCAFDFPLRSLLKEMCDSGGSFNMRRLHGAGLAGIDPFGAVTFVENHDTDKEPGLRIVSGKMLAYAYILTAEGYPSVFYRDWADDPGSYGLRSRLAPLLRIHERIASGTSTERWMDDDVYVFERKGGRRLLTGLNDSPTSPRTVTVQTGFAAKTILVDYTGHQPAVQTDAQGRATITIPANADGAGYVCYSTEGAPGIGTALPIRTTQEYAGAADLDIQPAESTRWVEPCRILVDGRRPVVAELYLDTYGFTKSSYVVLQAVDDNGRVLASRRTNQFASSLAVTLRNPGYVRFRIRSFAPPSSNPAPKYWLKTLYTAPRVLIP